MSEKPKILIVGAGTFGFAIFIVLQKAGHDVYLWDVNRKEIFCGIGHSIVYCNRYPWMCDYTFSYDHIIPHEGRIDAAGYDYVFFATPMMQLRSALTLVDGLDQTKTTIVTMQKGRELGYLPYHVVLQFFAAANIISFTGAGFGEDIAAGHTVRMIATSGRADWRENPLPEFKSLFVNTNIKLKSSDDNKGICWGGIIRTADSPIQSILKHCLSKERGTLISALAGLNAEYWMMLKLLGAKAQTLQPGSPEWMMLTADLELCSHPDSISRNDIWGKKIAEGKSPIEALDEVVRESGVVEGYHNIKVIHDFAAQKWGDQNGGFNGDYDWPDELIDKFPYHCNMYQLTYRGKSLQDCIDDLRARQKSSL